MDDISQWILRAGWFLGAWLFAFGAAAGSFLNVVVYRLPARKSLVHPGSSCPVCGHPIRWYHNTPILSWLLLRGRCYDCGAKIPARYPLVELAGGVMFAGLAAIEVWPPIERASELPAFLPHASGADIIARYVYHVWLLATLLAAALIERDGKPVPRRMIWLAAVVGLVVAEAWPEVQPQFGYVLPGSWNPGARPSAIAASVAGGLTGLLAGWIFSLVGAPSGKHLGAAENRLKETRRPDALALACVGTFVGWQGAVLVGVAATVLWLMVESRSRLSKKSPRWGWTALVLLAAIGWIVLTRNWHDRTARWGGGL